MRVFPPILHAIPIALGLNLLFVASGALAEGGSVPSFNSLRLETWSPQNNFRPI